MEEISLPSSSNLQIFGDNQCISLYESEAPVPPPTLGLSKFATISDFHNPPQASIDQVRTQEPTHFHDHYSESLGDKYCAECSLETSGAQSALSRLPLVYAHHMRSFN